MDSSGAAQVLEGGNMAGPVQRIGATVRRPTGPWTPTVHGLLRHLDREDYRGAPRVLGIDENGREILTFIPGRAAHPRVLDDHELQRVAFLIREYHTAAATFSIPPDAAWHPDGRDPTGAREVMCHNDLAPGI